jgi:hypothetical protein
VARPSNEASRVRARVQTRRRICQALEEVSLALSYGADVTQEEREWFFLSALARIENYERLPKMDRITEPSIATWAVA